VSAQGPRPALDATALARLLDHSVLKPEATLADIRAGADVVREWRVGYYCVQPVWVRAARASLGGTDATVVAVVGFPHGCDRTPVKADAARLAVDEGAREIDMVVDIGALRGGAAADVEADIGAVVRASGGHAVKVILETAVLTDDEKRLGCRLARDAGAAFVKTSTGFHPAGGATTGDVRLMRDAVGAAFGVKASGGIRTLDHVRAMLDAGANRIGTSASAAILAARRAEDAGG
jgi:deoxyribose-phosphate aldolase